MKDPEQIRMTLEEGIYQTINQTTEGLLKYNQTIWVQVNELVELVLEELLGREETEEAEELYADMDQFSTEE